MADTPPSSHILRAIEDSFPIVEINRLAVPERNAFKPICQVHKWFARRASCVFRAILLSCLKPLPLDEHGKPLKTGAQVIMEEFYKDHSDDPDTKDKVILGPFMGGGTTVVEALRLGCRVIGIDLNPVAWFVVKTEVEPVDLDALQDACERLAERPVVWSGKSVRETLLSQYRTEREIAAALERARCASAALRSLAQDLSSFNLGQYMALRGQFTLEDLRDFCLAALPRLGGAILPDGECYRVEVPSALQSYPRVEGSYRGVTFDRKLAMRRKQARLLGLGHPLVDALLAEWQTGERSGTVTILDGERSAGRSVRMHCLAHVTYEDGPTRRLLRVADLHPDGSWTLVEEEQEASLLILLRSRFGVTPTPKAADPLPDWAAAFRTVVSVWEAELRAQESGIVSIRFVITGIVYGIPGESEEKTLCKSQRREETRMEPLL